MRYLDSLPSVHGFFNLRNAFDNYIGEVFNINSFVGIFFDVELYLIIFAEQIQDSFIVYFQVRTSHQEFFIIFGPINASKNVYKCLGYDSFVFLCVC